MTNPTTNLHDALPKDRWEHDLVDKKPLYDAAEAKAEADRCLYCADAPCIKACPTSIDIPTFIKKIASGNVRGSARTILEQNLLGYSCARVCPVEVLCVGNCVLNHVDHKPIAIGRLQRYATEHGTKGAPLFVAKARGTRKVALVGAGPASLACAGVLALAGVEAVIFEKRAVPGGLNTTGIAPYKLHVEDALHEVDMVRSLGVEIRTGVELGTHVMADALLAEYDAVFLGLGLGIDNRLEIPGEDGPGVMGATAWIETMKLDERAGKPKLGRVLVIGGGNTALDVARESALLGADEVSLVYRRGETEMSGYAHELDGARMETVRLLPHRTPLAFERDAAGALLGLRVRVTEPGHEPREEVLPCELCAIAIGQEKLGALAAAFPGLTVDSKGRVDVSPSTRRSSHPKVYAGGDCINGGKEVVNAVADGRDAAYAMLKEFGDE
jgi:glutamate synthase (NADPH/NADH) small chain